MFAENTDKGYKQKPKKQSIGHWEIRCKRRTSACYHHNSATLRQWSWVRQWWNRKWGINTVQEENRIVLFQVCDGHSPKSNSSFENDQNHYSGLVRCLDRGSLYLYTCISTLWRQRGETRREDKTGRGLGCWRAPWWLSWVVLLPPIFQTRRWRTQQLGNATVMEWVAISCSRGSSWPRNRTYVSCVSCTGRQVLYHCATWEAHRQKHPQTSCSLQLKD